MLKLHEVYKDLLNEVDWEGEFSDVNKACTPVDVVVKAMNEELARLRDSKIDPKNTKDRGKMDPYFPLHKDKTKKKLLKQYPDGELGVDIEKYIKAITTEPKQMWGRNRKAVNSTKEGEQDVINIGLPALIAIVYDKDKEKFYHVNTCPGAGDCRLYCYARRGQYGMNDDKILNSLQMLNFLLNDPENFRERLRGEIEVEALRAKNELRKNPDYMMYIRWNDSGDFFSESYLRIAKEITNELIEKGYPIKSYAYTKIANRYLQGDENFVMNFSTGSKDTELEKLDLTQTKYSEVVQKLDIDENPVFKDLFIKPEKGYKGLPKFVEGGELELKKRISKMYNIPLERLMYQWELPNKEVEKFKYDVIVMPSGDSDIGAQRMDVHRTFLLFH